MGGSKPTLIGLALVSLACSVMVGLDGGSGRCCGDGSEQPCLVCKILCSPFKPCKGIFLSQVICIII